MIIRLITKVLTVTFALLLVARFVPGIEITGFWTAVVIAIVLGFLNLIVRPILVILTLPITLLTLGLFLFVLNAILFWLASVFVGGFVIDGFLPALLGSLIVSFVSWLGNKLLP
jgi:putative membrane protein